MKKVDNELIIKEILEDIFFPFSLENVQKNEGKLIGNSIKSFLELLIKTNPQPENHFKKGNESYYKLLACFIYYLVESNNKFLNLVLKNLHDFLVSEQFPDKIESLIISHEIYNLFKLKKSMDNGDNTFYKDFIKNILKRKTLEKVILLNTLIELGECDTAFYLLNDSVLKIKLKGLIPYYHNICRYQIGTLSIEDKDELIRSVENDELLNKLPDETQEVNKSNYFDFVNLKGLLNLNKHADIEAEEVFKKCLDIAKTDNQKSDAYLGLARIQLIRSNNKKSQEYIDESLTHNPNNPLSMLTQSIIYAKNNSETKSNEFFSSAIRLIDYKPKNQAHLLILELEYILDKKIDLNDINSSVFYFNFIRTYNRLDLSKLSLHYEKIYDLSQKMNLDYKQKEIFTANFKYLFISSNNASEGEDAFTLYIRKKEELEQKEREKLAERTKTFQDLAHTVKNIVSSVKDSIVNLKSKVGEDYNHYINPSLRGIGYLQDLFNTINQSFTIRKEDFFHDANNENNAQSLHEIIIIAMRYAIGNMFDPQYFAKYQKKYFPSIEDFLPAKKEWSNFQTTETDKLVKFLNDYFFKFELEIKLSQDYKLSDTKESKLKLLLLLQEIFLNAVKYSSIISKPERLLSVLVEEKSEQGIFFEIKNSYDPDSPIKNTGVGSLIMKNYSNILFKEFEIQRINGIYCLNFALTNFWSQKRGMK